MISWDDIRYFKPAEFDSPDDPGSGDRYMDIKFVQKLDKLRADIARPMKINSGYRTAKHNKSVGGKPKSAHREGRGADIECKSSRKRFDVIQSAIMLQFWRIGIGKTFVHLDDSRTLPQGVMWLY